MAATGIAIANCDRMRRLVVMMMFATIGFAACDEAGPGQPDAPQRPDGQPQQCYFECFEQYTCADGVATEFPSASRLVDCSAPLGTCPQGLQVACARGCRADLQGPYFPHGYDDTPAIMCEENRPKQVGDPCVDESGCRPEVATWDAQDVVTNVYLRCDVGAGRCVVRDPPVVPDWLAHCGLVDDGQPGDAFGAKPTTACAGGWCLYEETSTCVKQGCTITCTSDGECPPGAVCQDHQICKPGPPNSIGVDLTCP